MVRYHKKIIRKKYLIFLFFLVITMGVGYAYLSTSLKIGGTTKVLKPSFATDSWSVIVSNVKNKKTYYYHVGDTKEIDMGDLGIYTIRIANMSTPSECSTEGFSQTACGFVLEFADILSRYAMIDSSLSESAGWTNSKMRTYINQEIYDFLPSELKMGIIDTYVVSSHSSHDSENFITTDKLYLLSSKEVFGKDGIENVIENDTAEAETRQLDYYKNIGVTTAEYSGAVKINITAQVKDDWWLRSAISNYGYHFYYVGSPLGIWKVGYGPNESGVSPAFRLG